MINDLRLSATDLRDNNLGGDRLVDDYLRKTQIIRELQSLVFDLVPDVLTNQTLSGVNQRLVCRNVAPISITLSASPSIGSVVDIKRRGDIVNIVGVVDGAANPSLSSPLESIRLLYDGTEYVKI